MNIGRIRTTGRFSKAKLGYSFVFVCTYMYVCIYVYMIVLYVVYNMGFAQQVV